MRLPVETTNGMKKCSFHSFEATYSKEDVDNVGMTIRRSAKFHSKSGTLQTYSTTASVVIVTTAAIERNSFALIDPNPPKQCTSYH
jgi:hypothetical protein